MFDRLQAVEDVFQRLGLETDEAETVRFLIREHLQMSINLQVLNQLQSALMQNHGGWNSDDHMNNNLGRFRLSVTDEKAPARDPLPPQSRGRRRRAQSPPGTRLTRRGRRSRRRRDLRTPASPPPR